MGHGIPAGNRQKLLNHITDAGVVPRDRLLERMSERQDLDIVADLREIFNLIDVDHSGHFSFDEFT